MSRYVESIVPPVPRDAAPEELEAYRYWRRGHGIREAAEMAGISWPRLQFILNQKSEPMEHCA